ncbi:Vesicle-associated protein 4-2 [Vitis vinifera]|uniref:Vesicle-associated protein 4-2 n=1 Tax=Vitis vinifera TaxID=29760 RepID=A0A438IEQ5_VITVI|nr:Vesicle-associated protein 4-2 [Vitis vinifera]
MAVDSEKSFSEEKVWSLCKMPFWQSNNASSSSSTSSSLQSVHQQSQSHQVLQSSNAVSFVTKSLLPTRRRLHLDPPNKLYFPYEPGKQVRSAISIKNISRSHLAFKFQTTAPKSCYMRPPGGILAPGESLIATVFKFVEHPENNEKPAVDQKSKVKFKIMSLKVKGEMDYVPELDQVAEEQILRVVFLDTERPSPPLEKLKRQLAEAEAALEARKKPPEDTGPRIVGEGLVIDEWKEEGKDTWPGSRLKGLIQCNVWFPLLFYAQAEVFVVSYLKSCSFVQGIAPKLPQGVVKNSLMAQLLGILVSIESIPHGASKHVLRHITLENFTSGKRYKMGFINKAFLAVTLGAAFGLEDQVMKSNSSALKLNYFAAIGSSSSQELFRHGPQGSMEKPRGGDTLRKAREEPLRMVVYLSCWGPN